MKSTFVAKKCDLGGTVDSSGDKELLKKGYKIVVEYATSGDYVISVPKFTSGSQKVAINEKFGTNDADPKSYYFLIDVADFEKVCAIPIPTHSFTVGIPTIPVKLRFGNGGDTTGTFNNTESPRNFQFTGNLNLGLSGGYKYSFGRDKEYSFSVVTGFTIGSVDVDSTSTRGSAATKTSAASFSPHLGLVFDFKQAQFGIYSGFDFLGGKLNQDWNFRNQPWLGIGLGYNIFKVGGSKGQVSGGR
jgi:hypothetical protein